MDNWSTFGQWIKARRRSLDLTQEQLAQQAGCSSAAVKKIESDERRPSRQVAALLAEHLQVPPEQRAVFVQVARGELSLQRLPAARIPADQLMFSTSPGSTPENAQTVDMPALEETRDVSPSSAGFARVVIPQPATELVGRERELETIIRLLQDNACRMLTLTGVGGIGKTRLAIEAAVQASANLRQIFPDGVFFVSLSSVDAPSLIVPAVASVLDVPFSGPGDTSVQLFQSLRGKRILLVLDTLEHLLEGVELFNELLHAIPGSKLLLTSREQLHLQAEWVFEVGGLPVPQDDGTDTLAANSAVQLFIQRARQMHSDFQTDAGEITAIGKICQLVQGLPLAIVLAARWTRTLSCAEIAQEIERGLELLSSGKQAASTQDAAARRHRSLRAVFDHSWALLTGEERRALMRLSVFRGGFRREAAGQVAGAGLPVLSALIDKSLLSLREPGRYNMHNLVQQYMAERLAEDAAITCTARLEHSRYYLTLLRKNEPALRSPDQKDALSVLDEDIDNIRLAWNTIVESVSSSLSGIDELRDALDLLYEAAEPLYYYYELHQYFQEAQGQFKRAAGALRARLAAGQGRIPHAEQHRLALILAHLLNFQAFFNQRPGNNQGAQVLFEESLSLLRSNPLTGQERFPLAFALVHLGVVRWALGDFEQAARLMEEGLDHSQAQPQTWLRSLATGFLGGVSHDRGDYQSAYRLLRESVSACQVEGDPEITMLMVVYLSRTLMAMNRFDEPRALLEDGLKAVQETGNRWLTALGLEYLARIARAAGEDSRALHLMEESIRLHRAVGDSWSLSLGLIELSRALRLAGAYHAAEQHALEALKIVSETGYTPIALESLGILAAVDAQRGRTAEALILITHILQHPASKQDTRDQAEALRAEIAARLAPEQRKAEEERARMKPFAVFLDERYGIKQAAI